MQKENELFNLSCFIKKLKNLKVSTIDLDLEFYHGNFQEFDTNFDVSKFTSKDKTKEENFIKRILCDDLEMKKEIYQQTTKIVISEKNKEKKNKKKIEDLKEELENLKNPKTETNSQMMNNYNTMPNSNYTKNTNFNSEKGKTQILYMTTNVPSKIKNLENSFQSLTNKLKIKKKEINNLTTQFNELRSKNEKFSKYWIGLNQELCEKFSEILKYEMKIEKLKTKAKVNSDKINN